MLEKYDLKFINMKGLTKIMRLIILYFFHRINPSIEHFLFKKERILKICVGGITSPANIDLYRNIILGEGSLISTNKKLNLAYNGGKPRGKLPPWFPVHKLVS
jgi:hypothetical protein